MKKTVEQHGMLSSAVFLLMINENNYESVLKL